MVIREELNHLVDVLKKANIENAMFEANLIVRHFLGLSPIEVVIKGNEEILDVSLKDIENALNERISGKPLQYILKSQEFMGLDFYVDENVLIPRADTECLVEYLVDLYSNMAYSCLDICTGSGCIAISLAHFNKKCFVRGIDISKESIEVAKINAKKNDVENQVDFVVGDLFSYDFKGKYDVIVSNPPYITSSEVLKLDNVVKDYEPRRALDGGADGLDFYKYIVEIAPKLLNENGILAFEIGYDEGESVSNLMKDKFSNVKVIKDLCDNDRVVTGKVKKIP